MHRSLNTAVLVVVTGLVLTTLFIVGTDGPSLPPLAVTLLALLGIVWVWRLARSTERRQAARLRDQELAAALTDQRIGIARDLHDLVSHGLGLITVRASVARAVDADRPAALVAALADIERTGRATTLELRRMLEVLRSDSAAPLRPLVDTAGIDAAVAEARSAGLSVDVTGEADARSEGVALVIRRVVQEGLANAARHAGPTRVKVCLSRVNDRMQVRVADEGPAAGWRPHPGAGRGLLGLRELAESVDGTVEHGPHEGGYLLSADIADPEPGRE